ncbi:CoB--CoM heterodisulfide reductase [Geoglobus ahangari]|uniref:CoB--CoM heterodisulfide reductase n=1 Tax=Geoglobus ahangari TaxID=113653 RepID=A0A0F7IGV8_9EURY|nr:(Fe-S)-binding protein [Geoglobus ahangari]AKG91912.1 CoB--CoM heterodisulfide reductase [Geoglobus ahangari]
MKLSSKFIEDEAFVCVQCHYCRVCPAFQSLKWESVSPRGRMYLLKGIAKGQIEPDSIAVEDFYKCTTCGACEVVCQTSIPLIEVWERARAEFVEAGKAPLPAHRKMREVAEKNGNPYGEKRGERSRWAEGFQFKDKAETIYFAGCTASYRMYELARNTVEFLNKAGIDYTYAGEDEYCCGSPFLRTGQRDIAKKFFLKNYEEWKRRGVRRILTTCSGCFRTIAKDYPEISEEFGLEWDFEVVHTSQLIHQLVEEGKVEFEEWSERVTYHDPCHLGRHMGVYEEPRVVLEKMGAEIVEMEHSRENALCCGAGGGVKSQFKELAMDMGKRRIEEAKETKAKYLVSCCPFCKLHLKQASEGEMEVIDLIELVNSRAKVLNNPGTKAGEQTDRRS